MPAPAHPRTIHDCAELRRVLAGGRCCSRTARPRRPRPHATRGVYQSPRDRPLCGVQTNSTCSRTSPPTSRTCPGDPGPKPGCPPLSRADGPRATTDGPTVPPAAPPIEGGGIPGRHCWSPATIRSTLAWPGTRYKRLQAGLLKYFLFTHAKAGKRLLTSTRESLWHKHTHSLSFLLSRYC